MTDNELIAEFVGIDFSRELYSWRPGCYEPLEVKHLQYHNSWNWLMPVVEEISAMEHRTWLGGPAIEMNPGYCSIRIIDSRKMCSALELYIRRESWIDAVYEAVVEFIKWYNLLDSPKE